MVSSYKSDLRHANHKVAKDRQLMGEASKLRATWIRTKDNLRLTTAATSEVRESVLSEGPTFEARSIEPKTFATLFHVG